MAGDQHPRGDPHLQSLLISAAPRPPAPARPQKGEQEPTCGAAVGTPQRRTGSGAGAGAVVSGDGSEHVISWTRRFDLARIKTQLSARRLTKITVQLNKKNYLITQACSLVVKPKELQAYVNIAALQQHYFTETVVLL